MNFTIPQEITIHKADTSRIHEVDFSALQFGSVFSDHMFSCDFEDGTWKNAQVLPYGPLTISPAAKVFHYGQAVFEGMKAFKDENGGIFMFRPEDNFNRINKSAVRMAMPEFPRELFFGALHAMLKLDSDWIKPGLGNSLYIRPFSIATQVGVSASPSNKYKFIILLSPAQAYYTGDVKVIFSQQFSRAADGGVGFAKAAGNYGAQFYPTNLARERGFQQVIWTDSHQHEYLEEAGTMNIFFRLNDTLITAPNNDRILDGITRKSVLKLAEAMNIPHEVRRITVSEVKQAQTKGELKEIFGAGTAAVISPISAFSHDEKTYELPKLENSYAATFKKRLMEIQYNISDDPFGWRYKVE